MSLEMVVSWIDSQKRTGTFIKIFRSRANSIVMFLLQEGREVFKNE